MTVKKQKIGFVTPAQAGVWRKIKDRMPAFAGMTVALLLLSFPARAAEKESAMDRTLRTGVIRCGYYVFPPFTIRDPNTNKLSGFVVDYMERLASRAAMKVEWTEEVTWANWVPEIQAGRFDVMCTPVWPELAMLKVVTFTDPLFFAGLYPIVRKDDARFTHAELDRLNKPDVTILTQEGNVTESIAKANFPKAKFYTLPATASGGEYYQSLVAKKADVSLTDRNGLFEYEKNNGKNFKFIAEDKPLKLQSFPMSVARGETGLQDFLNQSIRELDYSGDLDRTLRKWEPEPGRTWIRVSKPDGAQK